MTNFNRLSLLGVPICAALLMPGADAQTTTPSTTLCAAITSLTANTLCLTSITNVAAGQTRLYIDGELTQTVGIPTNAGVVKVQRGLAGGGPPQLHASGAQVWIGLVPSLSIVPGVNGFMLGASEAYPAYSACTRSAQTYLPLIYPALGLKYDCDANTGVWKPWGSTAPVVVALDTGANNAVTSAVGTTPAFTGIVVQLTLAHSLQAGANTFAYAGGTALNIKSSRNPANSIATAYVATGVVNLQLSLVSSTLTWLDLSQ